MLTLPQGIYTSPAQFPNFRTSEKQKVFDSFKFTKARNFGAVLVAEAPVQEEYFQEDTPFYRWLKVNFPALLHSFPEFVESDTPLWIITKTYHTSKCSIACWEGSQQETSLEIGFDFVIDEEVVSASPDASKIKVKTSGPGWAHYGICEVVGSTIVSSLSIGLILGRKCR
jgi:hypothetical protein